MTTALILLAAVITIVWAAWLWRTITSGGAGDTGTPRHAESDWTTSGLPSRPYSRVPRLP